MSNEGLPSDLTGEQLRRLISAWCDGNISAADLDRLQTALRSSREARSIYIAFMALHAGIHGEIAAKEYLQSILPTFSESPLGIAPPSSSTNSHPRNSISFSRKKLAAAYFTAAGAALVALFVWYSSTSQQSETPRQANKAIAPTDVIAQVISATQDCEWSLDHHGNAPQGVIRGGDLIRVARGKLKLRYENGVELTLHGPALFEVVSEMEGRVLLGRLKAKIAKGGEGFSVLTPRAVVVDLGTELGIEVDDAGATDVVVFDGSVDLLYTLREQGTAQQRRLFTGEAARLGPHGTISRIVSISHARYFGDLSAAAQYTNRSPIISAVRDNIQRDAAWNYYEIVHGGMSEDARAFVDRQSHEWNGIDARGMPKYLVGGDYVKMFNNDKCRKDIEIIVTLDQPCKLYILFDDRIPAPEWLRKNFRNTGDKIGIDGGPWVYRGVASQGVTSAAGPGVSIDDIMSVWVREVNTPGPVRLGPTETPHDDLNMYGIVAVPLPPADS